MGLTRARVARRKARRIGLRYKTFVAAIGGVLAVLPALAASGGTETWANRVSTQHARDTALVGGFDPKLVQVSVDGSLPEPPTVESLPPYELPNGPLGIPGTALKAYRNAADIMAIEQPNCHIDWALIASIGRIESNHARGGYVDVNGYTLEPILGPELNGVGAVAAIPDTDQGRYDRDTVWDRAVGPTQFIPSTWRGYASDGNGDGVADPNNIFDATLATGRYLCSGGLDLANPDQLRTAIYRYNNSDVYVDTVILWAEAYRKGVSLLPDSQVPIGAPAAPAVPAPAPVTPPPAPPATSTPPVTAPSSVPPTTTSSEPSSPTTTTPSCVSATASTTPSTSVTPTSTPPPCETSSTTTPPSTTSSLEPTTS